MISISFTPTPTKAGGVGFYFKSSFDYDLLPDLKLNLHLCEDIWFRVKNVENSKLNGNGLIIGVIYRYGHNVPNFSEKLSEQLLLLNFKKEKYLLVGDFNVNLMKYNLTTPQTAFLNTLNSVGCNAFIDKPTRVSKNTASCIDHVHSNLDTGSLENHIILADVSDHFGTLSKIEGITWEAEKHNCYFRKTNLTDEKWQHFNLDL